MGKLTVNVKLLPSCCFHYSDSISHLDRKFYYFMETRILEIKTFQCYTLNSSISYLEKVHKKFFQVVMIMLIAFPLIKGTI